MLLSFHGLNNSKLTKLTYNTVISTIGQATPNWIYIMVRIRTRIAIQPISIHIAKPSNAASCLCKMQACDWLNDLPLVLFINAFPTWSIVIEILWEHKACYHIRRILILIDICAILSTEKQLNVAIMESSSCYSDKFRWASYRSFHTN